MNNESLIRGGAVYNVEGSETTMIDCEMFSNLSYEGISIYNTAESSVILTGSDVGGGPPAEPPPPAYGPGIYNVGAGSTIT